MFFTVLTFIAAFLIETIGTVVSVIGLSTLFGANPIIIALAVALDIGKLVVVALLYKYWGTLNTLMKTYGLIAACVTMVITSAGAAGYLAGEFQKAIVGTQEGTLKVQVLKDEQAKLEARKKQIDDQIANLPANFSRSRVALMKQFEEEQRQVTARLTKINEELPQLQIAQISTEAKAGPILYIAKAFDIPVEEAVKWVILMIIFVFDPLAVFLIVAGNFLLDRHRKAVQAAPENGFTPPAPMPPAPRPLADEPQQLDDNHELVNYPDASQTKVYTRQDLIDLGVSDEQLIAAGYEPREVVPEVRPPVEVGEEPVDEELKRDTELARRAGMSLEAWREMQLKRLDRIQQQVEAINEAVLPREQITKSTLGIVEPDSTVKGLDTMEVGYKTGAYRTGSQPK